MFGNVHPNFFYLRQGVHTVDNGDRKPFTDGCGQLSTTDPYNCPCCVEFHPKSYDTFYESTPSFPHIYSFNPSTPPIQILNTYTTTETPQKVNICCLDSGISRTLVGQPKFQAYTHQICSPINTSSSSHSFCFRTGIQTSSGSFIALLPKSGNAFYAQTHKLFQ